MSFKSIDSVLNESTEPTVSFTPQFTTKEVSIEMFIKKLREIDGLTDKEVQDIIKRQYEMFLDYDLFLNDPNMRQLAQDMFSNPKFLKNLIYCVPQLNLNDNQKILCNKLAYDYITYHTPETIDPTVRSLLLDLSSKVNIKTVIPLCGIMNQDSAKYVAMIRYSSYKEDQNISRLNKYLIKSGMEIREQDMIDIYAKLFERVSDLFAVTMLTPPEDTYNNLEMYRYDEMSKAMIDILDNMTSIEIEKVLRNYASTYSIKGKPPVRFSMRDIHFSYDRIVAVMHKLDEEGIYVP